VEGEEEALKDWRFRGSFKMATNKPNMSTDSDY
jgi:hypothetical protein